MSGDASSPREVVGPVSTQLSPGDSFSDVDSVLGAVVRDLGGTPAGPRFGTGSIVAEQFEIVRKLGQGGMGVVFLARDLRLDREVAIKLVGRRSAQATARLEREAQAMAQLSHPNVVAVYEVGQHDGSVYIAMEYVDGSTLRVWQGAQPRGWRALVEVYLQAARGLAAAHATGFVHRDFKPDNVLVGLDGRARVADFGLARTLGSLEVSRERVAQRDSAPPNPTLTASDSVLGTPAYMAPEQFNSKVPLGPRVDQFAFGVALHEAITGERPFGAVPNWIASAKDRVMVPPGRGTPRWLRRVLHRALALDPAQRYPDMHALVAALEHGLGLSRARRLWAAGLVGVAAAVAVGIGVGTSSRHTPCTDAAADQVWNPERRRALTAAFVEDGALAARLWTSTEPLLNDWIGQWSATRNAGCQATRVDGSQSELLLDRQVACLESRLARVAAVIQALASDRAPRQHVETLAADLPDVSSCADPEYLLARVAPPHDPAVRLRVAELGDNLAQAQIRLELGELAGLRARLDALLVEVEASKWAPLSAQTRWVLGQLALAQGERDEATTLLRDAYFSARAAGDDETASSIALSLAYLTGAVFSDRAGAELWLRHAEADVARGAAPRRTQIAVEITRAQYLMAAGDANTAVEAVERALGLADALEFTPRARLPLAIELAAALDAAGRHAEALVQYDATIAEAVALLDPQAQQVGMLHNNRGLSRYYVGNLAGAIEDLQISLKIGTDHGNTEVALAPNRLNLGLALAATGDLDGAAPLLEQVRAMWTAEPGAVAEAALVTKAIAWVELRRGHLDRAFELATESLALVRQALEPDHPEVAASLTLLGDVEHARGANERATAHFEAARMIWSAPANARNPASADNMASFATTLLALGRVDEALAQADEILQFAALVEVEKGSRATAHFVRAQIRGARGESEGAVREARQARELFEGRLYGPERAQVDRWLAR